MTATISTIDAMSKKRKEARPVGRPSKGEDAAVSMTTMAPPVIAKAVDELAVAERRSRSQQIALILEAWLRQEGKLPTK